MSFLSGNTKAFKEPEQRTLGIDPKRTSTNEAARPLPVIYGGQPVGVTFITKAFDQFQQEVNEDFGKEDRTIGYHYFCSFGALVCHGPVDYLSGIKFDGVQIWPPSGAAGIARDKTVDKLVRIRVLSQGSGYTEDTVLNVGGGATARPVIKSGKIVEAIVTGQSFGLDPNNPPTVQASGSGGSGASFLGIVGSETFVQVTITIGTFTFTWDFYWGMEATDYNAKLLELSDSERNPLPDGITPPNTPEEHPAYTGQCYFVANGHYLGYNRTQLQNIEVIVARYPEQDWLADASNVGGDCGLVHIIAEDFRNPRYGLGFTVARMDVAGLNAVAGILAAEGIGVSPIVNQASGIREHLKRLLEYFDAYHFTTPSGEFSLGLVREKACLASDPSTPYYDEEALLEVPEFEPGTWQDTRNLIYVTFTNRLAGFNPDSVMAPNAANAQLNEPSPETLQRPWFTRPDLADLYARAAAQIMGLPSNGGKLSIRRSRLGNIDVGGIFKLSYGHLGTCYLWGRVREIKVPDPYRPEVELVYEVDRGYLTQATTVPAPFLPGLPIIHEPEPIQYARLLELPYIVGLGDPETPRMAALAARPSNLTTEFSIILVEGASGTRLKGVQAFAYHGTLYAPCAPDSDGPLLVKLDGVDNLLTPFSGYSVAEQVWLAFVGDEVFAVTAATVVDPEEHWHALAIGRERFDTKRQDHATGAEVFLIQKRALTASLFETNRDSSSGQVATVKLQPFVYGSGADISELSTISETFTDRAKKFWKPRDLSVNGVVWYLGPASYSTGQGFSIAWTLTTRLGAGWEPDLSSLWFLELLDVNESVVALVRLAANVSSYEWSNAAIVAALGGETDCFVRIYARQGPDGDPIVSRYYDQIQVIKQ